MSALSLKDLMSIAIGRGKPNEKTFQIAEKLGVTYGGIPLKDMNVLNLIEEQNLTLYQAASVTAVLEIGKRLYNNNKKTLIRGPEDVYNLCKHMTTLTQENFRVLSLSTHNHVVGNDVIYVGHLTGCLVHPREVMQNIISYSAFSFICVHNHPSGEHEPSKADDDITKMLKDAGQVMQIPMTDHIILSDSGYYSYNKEGRIN